LTNVINEECNLQVIAKYEELFRKHEQQKITKAHLRKQLTDLFKDSPEHIRLHLQEVLRV